MSDFKFANGFLHGFATAAYQIEGSTNIDGRGPSVWDDMAARKNSDGTLKIIDGSSGEPATDSYNRYREDVALLRSFGVNCHRFSLSWSRIIPLGGSGDVINLKGVEYYNDYIDELLANGIVPMVTLFHWDLPSALQERYKGWLDKDQITRDFVNYCKVCFDAFGDRVKYWITLNEPFCVSILGHSLGVHAPGRTSDRNKSPEGDSSTEPWIAGHSLILAHASAARLYRRKYASKAPGGSGKIGISLNGDWCEPWDSSEENLAAAQRAQEFWSSWFADPIYLTGDYPECMRAQLGDRLPRFTPDEQRLVLGSSDFYGMNHYTTNLIKNKQGPAALDDYQGNVEYTTAGPDGSTALGTLSELDWLQDVPWGFHKLLVWLHKRYNVPIVVTECGFAAKGESDLPVEEAIKDTDRVNYFRGYLASLERAVKDDHVHVLGFCAWSCQDNWEWAEGYGPRFGLTHVDYETQKRTPKASAWYVKEFFDKRT